MNKNYRAALGISLACLIVGALAGTAYAGQADTFPGYRWNPSATYLDVAPSQPPRIRVAQVEQGQLTLPLTAGTELVRGERYWSPSGAHFLTLNPDGNLVVARADGGYVWGFDTQNVDFPRVGRVVWQEDGNLAAYAEDGSYIWSALTENPDPSAQLVLQPDGALQIVAGDEVKWTSIESRYPELAEVQLTLPLAAGTELVRGQRYWSQSGQHFLTLNPDGNLVVARADDSYVWGFDTQNVEFPRVGRVVWQEDGNLVAYAEDGSYIWSALTESPDPTAQLVLQPDGALQIVAGNEVMWTSIAQTASPASTGGPLLTQTNTGDLTLAAAQPADASAPLVAFVSTDGTAAIGSRSVFILTNQATGEATLVPVAGNAAATRADIRLVPGTYTVTAPPPSIGKFSTFTTQNVSASEITVPDAGGNEPVVTVSFSLATQRAPFAMQVDDLTATSANLIWAPGPGVEVGAYTLVVNAGSVAAATPDAGTPVPLATPTATSAVVDGLAPRSEYTFTLFATSPAGEALPARSYTATTVDPESNAAAFAVAPNTIVPTDFASLEAERIGEWWVRVRLADDAIERGSSSAMPGVDSSAVDGGGCMVGAPFLLTTAVAGDNSFYGVIDACESAAAGVSSAIVNTDVPLNAVFSYYHLASSARDICFDPVTGLELAADAAECSGRVGPRVAPESVAEVEELQPPEEAGTGEVQVTLLWATGDDLDVHVTDPSGAMIDWNTATSETGGQLDIDNRGGDCGMQEARAENVFWADGAPRGDYVVDVRNYKACTTPTVAKVQVRVSGELIVDQVVNVGVDAPITFTLRDAGASLPGLINLNDDGQRVRVSALDAASYGYDLLPQQPNQIGDLLPRRPDSPLRPAILVAAKGKGGISQFAQDYCEAEGSAYFDLGTYFGPHFDHDLKLEDGTLSWDIEAGVKAGINPEVEFSGKIECAADLDGVAFQLSNYPIPVNLELKPDISAAASATVSLSGPELGLTLGMASTGDISAETEWCWFVPCGVEIDLNHDTRPLTEFTVGDAEATIEGKLEFGAGVQANLGIGIKNTFVTAKSGFSLRMYPLAAELKAVVGTDNCIAGSVGAKLGVDLLFEAYILALGDEYRENLYESDVISYPGAEFEVGSCPED